MYNLQPFLHSYLRVHVFITLSKCYNHEMTKKLPQNSNSLRTDCPDFFIVQRSFMIDQTLKMLILDELLIIFIIKKF